MSWCESRSVVALVVNFFSLLTIAIAVSLDSFGVGVSYGVRRIQVPLTSLAIITACTSLTLVLAVFSGEAIAAALSPELTQNLGGVLLVGIGVVAVLTQFKSQVADPAQSRSSEYRIHRNADKSHGVARGDLFKILPAILNRPDTADFDRSKSISANEAFFLGLAVSLDSFVAGVGIRLMGYSPWVIIFALAATSSSFIYAGIRTGILIAGRQWFKQMPYFPGTLLIVIGLSQVF